MVLRKDDPIYYREKFKSLLKEAVDNGIEIIVDKQYGKEVVLSFKNGIYECASVKLIGK